MLIEAATHYAQPDNVPSVEGLCTLLGDIANRNGNPGKGQASAPSGGSRTTADGGLKTGWPAPSADLLRLLMDELPNDPNGPFQDRNDWQSVGHAVKGAAMAGGCEGEGREIWLNWCARHGGDPDKDARFWDTCHRPHAGWGFLMRSLQTHNPAGHDRVKLAVAQHQFAQQAAVNVAAMASAPFMPVASFDPADIPPRQFLYSKNVIAENISMLSAPGGGGKSALIMAEVLAMASGRELLAGDKPHHATKVWYHNGEDSIDEQMRRLCAAMGFHGVTHAELGGRLFLTSGRSMKIMLARQGKAGQSLLS